MCIGLTVTEWKFTNAAFIKFFREQKRVKFILEQNIFPYFVVLCSAWTIFMLVLGGDEGGKFSLSLIFFSRERRHQELSIEWKKIWWQSYMAKKRKFSLLFVTNLKLLSLSLIYDLKCGILMTQSPLILHPRREIPRFNNPQKRRELSEVGKLFPPTLWFFSVLRRGKLRLNCPTGSFSKASLTHSERGRVN